MITFPTHKQPVLPVAQPLAEAVRFAGLRRRIQVVPPPPPAGDSFQRQKKYVLIPGGTPIFFLHGTSSNGRHLNPLVHWFQTDVRSEHPGYVSYLPEVQEATGIDTVSNPKKQVPSALLAIRDMGDFRFQLTHNRIKDLRRQLAESGSEDEAVAQFFKLRPAERDLLVPIIRRRVLDPLTRVPDAWRKQYPQPLEPMVQSAVNWVHEEVAKLKKLRPAEKNLPIYDTDFIYTHAKLEDRKLNFDMNRRAKNPDVINIRPVHVSAVSVFESYLMRMEAALANDLASAFISTARTPTEARKRAELTAAKLMDTLAPRMVSIGHSQGGTALMASLMNYVKEAPDSPDVFDNTDPRRFESLGGRAIGMEVLLSAPLSGIPDLPAWGKKLVDKITEIESEIPLLRRKKGTTGELIRRYVWFMRMRGKMAVREMRQGSDLARRFEAELPNLSGKGVTVISAYDRNDAYVEPQASQLRDQEGRHPSNVFNLEVEAQQLFSFFNDTDDLLLDIMGVFPVIGPALVRLIPDNIKNQLQQFYDEEIVKVEQHRALITLPNTLTNDIGRQLLGVPANQAQALKTDNFEPFRYQSLVARSKSFQRKCLDLPTPQAASVLYEFTRQHPDFLPVLVENARENVPVENSASQVAQQMLEKTLDLMQRIAKDRKLREQYRDVVTRNLQLLAQADLPAFLPGEASLSERAARLLERYPAK